MNEQIEKHLDKILQLGQVPNSLLFAGPHNSIKEKMALKFARSLIQSDSNIHPDLYTYRPEGKLGLHSIETMRAFREEVYLPPYQSSYKVFILFEAERMLSTSANALLKTFEEPLSTSTIILVSSFPEQLLPTIRSRCQTFYFKGDSQPLAKNPLLFEILHILPSISLLTLLDKVEALSKSIEESCTQPEISKEEGETALQRQAREKEGEGRGAMAELQATEELWIAILSWYRDLHLLQYTSSLEHLFYPDEIETLQQSLKHQKPISLDEVAKLLADAKEGLARSAPLKHILERLFLELSGHVSSFSLQRF